MLGLMVGSIGSGQIVSRTGRYKWLMVGGMTLAAVGLLLLTQLSADTSLTVWIRLVIMGLGIGPSMAVFTIVVQNAVPFREMGVATSALTFFRQIGGSIGLAIAGTVFGSTLATQVPVELTAAGLPQQAVDRIGSSSAFSQPELTSVGVDLGQVILSRVPDDLRPVTEPLIPRILGGINEAVSLAIGSALWFGVAAAIVATVLVTIVLPELPLRARAGDTPRREAQGPARMAAFD